MPDAIEFDGACVKRGGRLVLDALSFRLPAGSLCVALGPNGAGKTSMLGAATGEFPLSSGTVRVLGRNLETLGWSESARHRRRIGFMPQLSEQAPAAQLSVRELVEISRSSVAPASAILPDKDREICDAWIRRFGLYKHAERPFGSLSGGEQRKAHLARIFAQEPELILLDEPAGHLDLPSQDDLVRLLGEVWRETKTSIVIVTHDLRQLPPETTQVLLLSHGRLLGFGDAPSTINDENLSALYQEKVNVFNHAGRYLAIASGKELPHG